MTSVGSRRRLPKLAVPLGGRRGRKRCDLTFVRRSNHNGYELELYPDPRTVEHGLASASPLRPAPSPASAPAAEARGRRMAPQSRHRRDRAVTSPRPMTDGRRIEVDLWLQPGAAVARAHVHDHVSRALRGARRPSSAPRSAGASASCVRATRPSRSPPAPCTTGGTTATASAQVRVEVEATPTAPGRPAARFAVDDRSAVVARRARARQRPGRARPAVAGGDRARVPRRDPLRPRRPPPSRPPSSGRSPRSPAGPAATRSPRGSTGPAAACAIPDPGEDGLAALLARPVGTRAARGRG